MITLYCNAVTRQRLSRSMLNFIERNQDMLGFKELEYTAWRLLAAIKKGRLKFKLTDRHVQLGEWLFAVKELSPELRQLGAQLCAPVSEKCWSMSQENLDRWARKSSVLAVRNGV